MNARKPNINDENYNSYLSTLQNKGYSPRLEFRPQFQSQLPEMVHHCMKYFHRRLGSLKGKKICDLGSGTGFVLAALALEGASAYGIEVNKDAISESERRFRSLGIRNARIMHANYFDKNIFDRRFGDDAAITDMDAFYVYPYNSAQSIDIILNVLIDPRIKNGVLFYHMFRNGHNFGEKEMALFLEKSGFEFRDRLEAKFNDKGLGEKVRECTLTSEEIKYLNERLFDPDANHYYALYDRPTFD